MIAGNIKKKKNLPSSRTQGRLKECFLLCLQSTRPSIPKKYLTGMGPVALRSLPGPSCIEVTKSSVQNDVSKWQTYMFHEFHELRQEMASSPQFNIIQCEMSGAESQRPRHQRNIAHHPEVPSGLNRWGSSTGTSTDGHQDGSQWFFQTYPPTSFHGLRFLLFLPWHTNKDTVYQWYILFSDKPQSFSADDPRVAQLHNAERCPSRHSLCSSRPEDHAVNRTRTRINLPFSMVN